MRIEYKRDGGFAAIPGLSKPFVLDSTDLAPAKAREMTTLVGACHFFDLPTVPPAAPPGAADHTSIKLTVIEGKRRRTVTLRDPIADPAVQALVEFVEDARREAR